jgi:hypothetical protein
MAKDDKKNPEKPQRHNDYSSGNSGFLANNSLTKTEKHFLNNYATITEDVKQDKLSLPARLAFTDDIHKLLFNLEFVLMDFVFG